MGGLALPYDGPPRALVRFLRQLPSLKRLSVGRRAEQIVVRAIVHGAVGEQLRSLRFLDGGPFQPADEQLMRSLMDGRLPLLEEIQLEPMRAEQHRAFVVALEKRRAMGLRPVGRVEASMYDGDLWRPLWS